MSHKAKTEDKIPENAFLIVNGSKVIPLRKSIVTIGRMEDNDVVVKEAQISRYHAQLRAVEKKYVLVDLKSTGGTSVNGTRITQAPLEPGDVISLAGVPLLYGQSVVASFGHEPSDVKDRMKDPGDPTKGITDSVELGSIDRYLSMFDSTPGDYKKS